MRTEGLRTE